MFLRRENRRVLKFPLLLSPLLILRRGNFTTPNRAKCKTYVRNEKISPSTFSLPSSIIRLTKNVLHFDDPTFSGDGTNRTDLNGGFTCMR